MNIQILPYIDQDRLKARRDVSDQRPQTTDNTNGKQITDFKGTLAGAQRAIESVTIDILTSGDTQKIRQAAMILSQSSNRSLSQIGEKMFTTGAVLGKKVSAEKIIGEDSSKAAATASGNSAVKSVSADEAAANAADRTTANTTANAADKPTVDTTDKATTNTADSTKKTTDKNTARDAKDMDTTKAADKAARALGCPSSLKSFFVRASEKYNVDVALLMAIAKTESNFHTDAVSSAGATGVMQIMPSTAKGLGVKDLYDPEDNIMGGAKEISARLKDYNGDLDMALAGYNAGIGNVRKYGGIPPFTETRNYIKKVNGYYDQAK